MTSFISLCFFGRANLKQIEKKTAVGDRGHRKNFEILRGVMAFLSIFEQNLIKIFALHLEPVIKCDAFCLHIFDLCVLTSGREWIQKILVGECNFELG